MIKQLAHICIHTQSLEKTRHFYSEILGMALGFDFQRQDQLFGFYLKCGANTFIEVFQGDPGEVGNINHLALEVHSMDDVIAKLKENDIEVTDKKLGADQSYQAWATDPNGVRIEFHEYTEQSMQVVGGTCQVNW